MSVCHFEDETIHDRSPRYNKLAGRLGTSNSESLFSFWFRRPLLLAYSWNRFPCFGKVLKSYPL